MITALDIHGATYTYPGKGHDRLYINQQHAFAAVFDGAGGSELSEAAVTRLSDILQSPSGFTLDKAMHCVDNLPEGRYRKATVAAAHIEATAGQTVIGFMNAGDSSIFFYNHKSNTIKRIAHMATSYMRGSRRRYVDTSEFLGNFRTRDEICALTGRLVVPASMEWSVIGCSDGICDDREKGILPAEIAEIIQTTPPKDIAETILSGVKKYDDAALFVMSYRY